MERATPMVGREPRITFKREEILDPENGVHKLHLSEGVLNNSEENIGENIKINIRRGLPQLHRHVDQPDRAIALIGGGPSLSDSIDDIKECIEKGYPIVALNGSHTWLDDNNIPYHAHVLLDSRKFNKRFIENPKDHVKYFICSQCDPEVFDALENNKVWIWHGGTCKFVLDDMNQVYGQDKYTRVRTGRTVILAALYIFRTLGFANFDIFGFDSCLMGDDDIHHAYNQHENDTDIVAEFEINGRVFRAHTWMIGQAQDFVKMTKILGHKFNMDIHGDGLIAHIVKSVAQTGDLVYEEVGDLDQVVRKFAKEQYLEKTKQLID